MSTAINIILDEGGTNEVTISCILIDYIFNKKLVKITAPQSTSNWDSGPKDTKIVDLLRLEETFSVRGFVNESYRIKLINLFKGGGVINFKDEDGSITVNIEKMTISKDVNEDDERPVQFTCTKGVNL